MCIGGGGGWWVGVNPDLPHVSCTPCDMALISSPATRGTYYSHSYHLTGGGRDITQRSKPHYISSLILNRRRLGKGAYNFKF